MTQDGSEVAKIILQLLMPGLLFLMCFAALFQKDYGRLEKENECYEDVIKNYAFWIKNVLEQTSGTAIIATLAMELQWSMLLKAKTELQLKDENEMHYYEFFDRQTGLNWERSSGLTEPFPRPFVSLFPVQPPWKTASPCWIKNRKCTMELSTAANWQVLIAKCSTP